MTGTKPAQLSQQAQPKSKWYNVLWISLIIILILITLTVLQNSGYINLRNFVNKILPSTFLEDKIQITSISTSSAVPGQLLTVYGKGFDRTSPLLVRFSDNKGYNLTLTSVQVTDTGVIVAVPPYVNFENFLFGPGNVKVQILSNSEQKSFASNPIKLEIKDLPKFTEPPGTITLQFLDDAIVQIEDTKKHIRIVENISGGSFYDPDSIDSLNKLAVGYTALKKEVESVMADKSKKVPFAQVGNQTLYYDQETLATADRLFGSLMQTQSQSKPKTITGAAIGISSSCRRLEGLDLSVAIACVQKRISFDDGLTSLIEIANEKHFKNPILEKTFSLNSFLSDVTFLGLTLPATVTAYNEDLAAITAATGKEEYEIASSLKDYYLDDLALKVLDRMIPFSGTALGIISDLIVGPTDALYRNSFKGILANTFTQGLARQIDPNTLSTETGFNLIKCGDLCGKTQKDFAVLAGVKGKGRVSSIPIGISCPGDCTEIYGSDVAVVELSAKPDKGYVFGGWSLACTGKGKCRLRFGKDKAVIATFVEEPEKDLEVIKGEDVGSGAKCPTTSAQTKTQCWSDVGGTENSDTVYYSMISAVYVPDSCNCPIDTVYVKTAGSLKYCQCKK